MSTREAVDGACDEMDRLREANRELLEALREITMADGEDARAIAKDAIAKARSNQ